MANRHLSRAVVLQTLFQWDFNDRSLPSITEVLEENAQEFASEGNPDEEYMKLLLGEVLRTQKEIDLVIEKAAPDWPLDKIAIVDRNILRIGLYELLYGGHDEVPPKVAINEAIELAKSFGGDSSSRFINGVLGSVYREMGEPGKDQQSRKIKNIPYAQMPVKKLVGSVVFANDQGQIKIALVHDVFGRWTLCKGSVAEGEDELSSAKRIIKEELGLEADTGELLGENEYIANDPEQGKVRKQVKYFLSESSYADLVLGESDGLQEVKWFTLPEVVSLKFYKDILPIITSAAEIILKTQD